MSVLHITVGQILLYVFGVILLVAAFLCTIVFVSYCIYDAMKSAAWKCMCCLCDGGSYIYKQRKLSSAAKVRRKRPPPEHYVNEENGYNSEEMDFIEEK